jgi:hypothetical protein
VASFSNVASASFWSDVDSFLWALVFMGLIDLAVPVEETPGFYDSYLLETGWGVLYSFLVGAAFVSLAVRPGMVMPVVQVWLTAVGVAVTAILAGSWVQLGPALLLFANGCVFWFRTAKATSPPGSLLRLRFDPAVGVAAVVLVPPAVLFATDMVNGYRQGRPPLDDDTWGIDHWPMQAALALAAAAIAVAVAVGVRNRLSGTVISASLVAVTAAWFGYWSAIYPNHAGSAGKAGGFALILWAVTFTSVVAWRLRRQRALPPR